MNALLVICTFIVIYRVITRGANDADTRAAGIMTGLVFALAEAFAFIAGGWWSMIGYAVVLWAVVNFCFALRENNPQSS